MKSFLYNYESLNPYERMAICENLRTSLNNAKVFLDKLMIDAIQQIGEHPPLHSQKAFVHNEDEDAPLIDPEDILDWKKDAPE